MMPPDMMPPDVMPPDVMPPGMMPPVEENYWLLPSGPTWLWWLLAILPLDSHGQVN